MKIFVDESGDAGLKLGQGSTTHFLVTAVIFSTSEAAELCSAKICELRNELSLKKSKEFHFNKDCEKIRKDFLNAVANVEFRYVTSVLDKRMVTRHLFPDHKRLYHYATQNAFSLLPDDVVDAKVVIDRCGDKKFGNELKTFLRQAMEAQHGRRVIENMSSAHSHADNLLQLADMVCGAVAKSVSPKNPSSDFRDLLKRQEIKVEIWPRL